MVQTIKRRRPKPKARSAKSKTNGQLKADFDRADNASAGEVLADVGCPDCRGVLAVNEVGRRRWLLFRCRVGHVFAADSLLVAKAEQIEQALWSAISGLGEVAQVLHVAARREDARKVVATLERQAKIAKNDLKLLDLLVKRRNAPAGSKERKRRAG